jgi:5-hydroxyisourate hydrolase
MSTPRVTTHVLDIAAGEPVSGLVVTLSTRQHDGTWNTLANATTDGDGRIREWPATASASTGDFRLRFATGDYFVARRTATLYPEIVVHVRIGDDESHHLPLLVGPFSYTTYRGR